MQYKIDLNPEYPNQEFDIIFEDTDINLHILLQTNDSETLMMSVFLNNKQLGDAFVCFSNQFVIPYPYIEEKIGGNFIFETSNYVYPNYENFNSTCNLYFVKLDEINA